MATLPPSTDLTGATVQEGQFKTAISTFRTFVADLLGTDSSDKAAARAALKVRNGARNLIIGGDFTTNPWVRGTSFAAAANGTYFADRFYLSHSTDGVLTVDRVEDSPTVAEAGVYSKYCARVLVTTADASIAAGQYVMVQHAVEGISAAPLGFGVAGTRYVTLSFWVKATVTGTYCVALRNSSSARAYVAEFSVSASNTWERKTVTIPVDTSGTWLYDTGVGVRASFVLACGSTYQTTAGTWAAGNYFATSNQVNAVGTVNNEFRIALVQFEPGDTATDFEVLPVTLVEQQCKRFARLIGHGEFARARSGTAVDLFVTLEPPMRASPTITLTANNPSVTVPGTATYTASGATLTAGGVSTTGFDAYVNGFSGSLTTGGSCKLESNTLLVTAEL